MLNPLKENIAAEVELKVKHLSVLSCREIMRFDFDFLKQIDFTTKDVLALLALGRHLAQ